MTTTIRRLALSALLAAPLLAAPAFAQTSPTREGTTITNTATASFTDANGNTYDNVTASASVTVGFLVGLDIVASGTATPAAPSTGNTLPYTIHNTGNGIDNIRLAFDIPAGISPTGYQFNGQTYTTLAALNAALATYGFEPQSNITVTLVYDVLLGYGGSELNIAATVTSLRDPNGAGTDSQGTTISPPLATSLTLTPDGGLVQKVPSNGTTYTEVFTITNTGNRSDTYSLVSSNGTVLTIVSVNGTAGSTGQITVAAGETKTFQVVYTVNGVAAGTSQDLAVTATSGNTSSVSDGGHYTVTVIRAALAMTKVAYLADKATLVGSTKVLPGQTIWYLMTVTNNGAAPASSVRISDPLPAQVTHVSHSGEGWTMAQAAGTVTANLNAPLSAGASASIWIQVTVK